MARRRKKRTTGRRRSRVGAMALNANSPVVQLGAVAIGYLFAGNAINGAIDKALNITAIDAAGTSKGKMVAVAEAGLGALLLMKKGKKSLPLTIAGGVLAGAGLKRLLAEFKIGGFQSVPVLGRVRGFQSVPVLGNAAPGYPVPRNGINGYTTSTQSVMGSMNGGHSKDDL